MLGNSRAAFDLAKLSGKVPGWAVVGTPVVAVAVVAAVTAYLAFGRHLALKLVGVAVVVAALAAPGLALGWANGTVSVVAHRTAAQETVVTRHRQGAAPGACPARRRTSCSSAPTRRRCPAIRGAPTRRSSCASTPRPRASPCSPCRATCASIIPDHGYDKMNTAYSYGGPPLAVKTVHRAHRSADQPLRRGQLRGLLARGQHPRRRLHPRRPSLLRPRERRLQVDRHPARLPAHPRARRARFRAVPPRPARRLHAHAAPAAVPQGDAAPVQPLERRLEEGPAPHQGHHQRDDLGHRLAQAAAASGRAHLPGEHVPGVHGAPRGRGRDAQRRLVRDPDADRDRPGGGRVHEPGPGSRRGEGPQAHQEDVPGHRLQR